VFKAHRLCASLNSRLESHKEGNKTDSGRKRVGNSKLRWRCCFLRTWLQGERVLY